jgi:hypothetical protein
LFARHATGSASWPQQLDLARMTWRRAGAEGKLIDTEEEDDIEAAARRILRAAKRSDFYAPIQYPRTYH